MRLFAGIDVGQSATKAALTDERGRILARASGGAGDELGLGAASTRLPSQLRSTDSSTMRIDTGRRERSMPSFLPSAGSE